jgi:coenzyme F420-0:L-glutamate ligase/coenzyme F420-1:gamma-L-glutamate ligase
MLTVFGVGGLPEMAGDDLATIIGDPGDGVIEDGDILAITSRIVSKTEARQVLAADRGPRSRTSPVALVGNVGPCLL